MFSLPSPVEPFRFAGHTFYIKRDDLIHPLFSGNKYRKLYRFIHTPSHEIDTILSYGGIQSNAMLSIAALCHLKGWRFEYIAKTVPKHLKANPTGNYKQALELGMQLIEVAPTEYLSAIGKRKTENGERMRVIPQGGADPAAKAGIDELAEEISAWRRMQGIERLRIATPSGTGTTAAFLAAALPECRVFTAPAVGDTGYLHEQIRQLMPIPENLIILETKKRYRFGGLDSGLFEMYQRLINAGTEFDLVYAPVMWTALLENIDRLDGETLYVHSGGISGNETMLARYGRMLNAELPGELLSLRNSPSAEC